MKRSKRRGREQMLLIQKLGRIGQNGEWGERGVVQGNRFSLNMTLEALSCYRAT